MVNGVLFVIGFNEMVSMDMFYGWLLFTANHKKRILIATSVE